MAKKTPKKKSQPDHQQIARKVLDTVAPDADERSAEKPDEQPEKNPAAVALGRMGGLKGGKARAEKLSKARRSEIAKKAAEARWGKKKRKTPK